MHFTRFPFALLLMIVPVLLNAQDEDDDKNLVINGSFEEYEGRKLKRMGSLPMATGWRTATLAKADLFSTLVPGTPIAAPINDMGDQAPLTGNNYAGIRWWSFLNKEPRAYMHTKLKKMLKKGEKYCVKYFVSLGDRSKYASAELGAYISKVQIDKQDENSLTYKAQVPHLKSKIYNDPYSWQGVCGVYEATGGEQYLIIGNFASNEATATDKVSAQAEDRAQLAHAYYYIDDVSVMPVKNASECTCDQLEKGESEMIFSRRGITNPSLTPSQKVDQQVFYFKRFHYAIPTSMEPWIQEMAELMTQQPELKVKLIGHIDETEKERSRMKPDLVKLGKQRADAVKERLKEMGIAPERMITSSKDNTEKADQTGSEVGQSKNRRVEVELMK